MARNGKRLGFLPDWRIFTYVILVINALFLIWVIAGASSSNSTNNCGSLDAQTCNNAQDVGKGIGVTLVIILWVIVDVILLVLWLITNRKKRECPVCGHDVKKGQMQCGSCGHDFRAAAQGAHQPQQPMGGQQPPPAWMPDPSGSGQMRWWDGQRYTEHMQPAAGPPANPQTRP